MMHSKTLYFIKFFAISFFIFIILNFFIAFIVLKNGVHINSFSIANLSVKQLYLKLDNRLNLDIKKLQLRPSQKNGTVDWFYVIEAFELLPLLFDSATIQELEIQTKKLDYKLSVIYKNNTFFIDSKDIYLYSTVTKHEDKLLAKPILHLKQKELFVFADLDFDPLGLKAKATGEFFWQDAKGVLEFTRNAKDIDVKIHSQEFTNLKDIFDTFGLNKMINAWTYEHIKAKNYKLAYMHFKHRLDQKLDLYNLNAKAVANDVKVKFHPKIEPVDIKQVELFFKDGKLLFNLDKPVYEKKDLKGSFVYISDLLDDKSDFIVVDIQTKAKFDKSIEDILNAYGIDIFVKQKSGVVDANVVLNIMFKNSKTKAVGSFKTKDAEFELFGYALPTKKAEVVLNNNLINFKEVVIKDTKQHFQTEGFIDTVEKKAEFNVDLRYFNKYNLALKNKNFITTLDFTDDVAIDIPFFNSHLTVGENFEATITDINELANYLPAIDFKIQSGDINVFSKDYENFVIKVNTTTQQPYLKEQNKSLRKLSFQSFYNLNKDRLTIKAKDNLFYDQSEKKLALFEWDLDLTSAIEQELLEKQEHFSLSVEGNRSDLLLKDHSLVIDNYKLFINGSDIKLQAHEKDADIEFSYKDQNLSLKATNLHDKTLHPLLNFTGIQEGSYDISAKGNLDSLKGSIKIKGGVVTNMKSYNNLIALINTIPSLALLKSPGFNEKGLSIKEGAIEFFTYEETIFITKLYIKGKAANLVGSGYIDLKSEKLDIDIQVKTVKEFGNAFSKIPLAGYIVFGEDKSVSFNAKIEGDLDNPKVKTQTASDILLTPYNLLKRTIESPFKLFQDIFWDEK